MPTVDELRKSYLDYFQKRGHLLVPSSSLIPSGDPTLLLTTAGMVQFKPYFLGEATAPRNRMTSSQKCFRTTDIDVVGDHKHLTFFEMLGNFSVGDYFKQEAIDYAWEFITTYMKLAPEKLFITVYTDDDEAAGMWQSSTGTPDERLYRYGKSDNWWGPPGAEGPCGPCSEIHYDFGEQLGCAPIASPAEVTTWIELGMKPEDQPGCHPNCDRCERFVELWNLVFMQFFQDQTGAMTPLPKPNIDTGMGLERAAVIVQGASNVYDTDLYQPIIGVVSELAGLKYGKDHAADVSLRVVAEHTRGATFLISDGVIPGNEGRGYVLRRLIRRAVRYGRKIGLTEPFIVQVAESVITRMEVAYPELIQNREFILKMLGGEEQQFGRVLEQGLRIIEDALSTENENSNSGILPGTLAFTLYDTYGFPVEETVEIARERGIPVDLEGFEQEMETQRERARAGSATKFGGSGGDAKIFKYRDLNAGSIKFVGYERLTSQTTIVALVTPDGDAIDHVEQGQEVEVVLRETPFYAEGGGQAGDAGTVLSLKGHIDIEDTQTPLEGLIVHKGRVRSGIMAVGEEVNAKVDQERRLDIARNHSSTHLLHEALRRVLGTHVKQAGSSVSPERLRFDFTHMKALSPDEIHEVERMVNEQVRRNLPSVKNELAYAEALDSGYLAFFGDKYGETVRVVDMGINDPEEANARPFSREVCGGTHLDSLGETGLFLITSEGSIGSGIRRVEAVTGRTAATMARSNIEALDNLALNLETTPGEIASRIETLQNQLDTERRRSASLERQSALAQTGDMLTKIQQVNGINVLAANVTVASAEILREMGDHLRDKVGSGVVVLGAVVHDRPSLVAMVTPDLVEKGLDAVMLIKEIAAVIGGGGGGRPTLAQAGGTKPEKMDDALATVLALVAKTATEA
ncbi:MAG: alanine--tRNA ligase [Chloroflexota bacterium]|nr:alanine--tRNA ligase [Chloroflexota bacterium]